MNHFNFLLSLLAASLVAGQSQRCPDGDGLLASAPLIKGREPLITGQNPGLVARADPPPAINLFVHIIAASGSRADGNLTTAEIDRQVQIVKNAYTPIGITFNHNPATHRRVTINPAWTGTRNNFDQMKRALHQGSYKDTLNLYLQPISETAYGGTCTNPWTQSWRTPNNNRTEQFLLDGCIVAQHTLDGSNHPFMNRGLTAVHEIGHWFGLFHPWEPNTENGNTCSASNLDDHVTDTNKMRFLAEDEGTCDETQDTCPQAAGLDPVHNYMGYTSDDCMNNFSEGQVQRMYYGWQTWRTNLTTPVI